MELVLNRQIYSERSTIGELLVNGQWQCWTLEDYFRIGPKAPGATAIPEGRYRVILDFSQRFQRIMPHLLDVPGFTGIRIHPGNTDADTEGCILVGQTRNKDFIGASQLAFRALFAILSAETEPVFITIKRDSEGDSQV